MITKMTQALKETDESKMRIFLEELGDMIRENVDEDFYEKLGVHCSLYYASNKNLKKTRYSNV